MKIACANGVLGDKIKIDSVYNCLVNDQGLPNTNCGFDLRVEHENLEFKNSLSHLAGIYTFCLFLKI